MSNQQQKHASVCLALIHNNVAERYNYIRPALEQLCVDLAPNYTSIIIEPSFRPEIVPHSTLMTFRRDIMYWRLNREWCRYRLLELRPFLLDVLVFLKNGFDKYLSGKGRAGLVGKKRYSYREMVVTENHIEAWSAFLALGADFLICFEDDAIFKENSSQRVIELLDNLIQSSPDCPVYADLAGGYENDVLKINNLETKREASFRFYSKPVTNTSCTYLINRPLATFFIEMLAKKPQFRLIVSDWLMNKLFILAEDKGMPCVCMHAFPTIFKQGSFTGEYKSILSQDRKGESTDSHQF